MGDHLVVYRLANQSARQDTAPGAAVPAKAPRSLAPRRPPRHNPVYPREHRPPPGNPPRGAPRDSLGRSPRGDLTEYPNRDSQESIPKCSDMILQRFCLILTRFWVVSFLNLDRF